MPLSAARVIHYHCPMEDGLTTNFEALLQAKIDGKTKPQGALGRMELLAAQIARIQQSVSPRMETCHLIIFAADHGMALSGVSAFPQVVTRQMVLNFLSGGAAANVFARSVGASLEVVDAGVAGQQLEHPDLRSERVGPGTQDAIAGPAMSVEQCSLAMETGRAIGAQTPADAICFGEMGIGNTSSAALISHKILNAPLESLIGRGTGLDGVGLSRKQALLHKAAARTDAPLPPLEALRQYGGFEIVMMAGAMQGAAAARKLVIVDGFIATAAALVAVKDDPAIADNLIYAHVSEEPGHRLVLQALDIIPLLDLGMRLGEGTGALLAWPLVKAAAAMLNEMASFDDAGVSGPA